MVAKMISDERELGMRGSPLLSIVTTVFPEFFHRQLLRDAESLDQGLLFTAGTEGTSGHPSSGSRGIATSEERPIDSSGASLPQETST